MTTSYTTRSMSTADTDLIGAHREAMFAEAKRPQPAIDAMSTPFREWVRPRLEDGRYLGWAIEHEGKPIAGAGLMIVDWPPHPLHPTDARRGYLLNVYVDPEHRGHGLARKLVKIVEQKAFELGIAYMTLHASALGRPVYERMGWKDTDEMSLSLPGPELPRPSSSS